jgi:hypothetical protein
VIADLLAAAPTEITGDRIVGMSDKCRSGVAQNYSFVVAVRLVRRLDSNAVVHGIPDLLRAPKDTVQLSDRDVPVEEPDLFEFPAGDLSGHSAAKLPFESLPAREPLAADRTPEPCVMSPNLRL